MSEDDVETVKMLKACRSLMSSQIQGHKGRVVDSPGDNILSEFSSVADAVQCAVRIQEALKERNKELPSNRKMEFRIGINLGDVIEDGAQIYGDGLNIAARLESIAPAGGICISGSAFDQVKKLLPVGYEFLGEKSLKNISDKIRVYRVMPDPKKPGQLVYACRHDDPRIRRRRRLGFLLVCICLAAGLAWFRHKNAVTRVVNGPGILKEKLMALHLPKKPSLAVLPFVNMSRDPDQEYFSDGLTEDLITDLSQVSGLFVIARNSVFAYKDNPLTIKEIGRELGVKYVLEGSVRKQGDRVRITAQLIDADTEGHVWAQRYDRGIQDIFSVQDEVRQKIVTALAVELTSGDRQRISKKSTVDLGAYDYYLRGMELMSGKMKNGTARAREMFEKAVALDPGYARAHAALGHTILVDWIFGLNRDYVFLEQARALAEKAIALDPEDSEGYGLLGHFYLWTHHHKKGIVKIEKAISLEPGNAKWLAGMGEQLAWAGRPKEAVAFLEQAMRLDPKYPAWAMWNLGHAYFLSGAYEKAEDIFLRALNKDPYFWPSHAYLALTYDALGKSGKIEQHIKAAAEAIHDTCPENWEQRLPYKDRELTVRILNRLTELGLH
ncbi:MAG: tetratricopeptide repeat protein [Desulfobacter sp.]|nr:MAG: tetratricopeptide repeat protein [Desulfobacter sp.]